MLQNGGVTVNTTALIMVMSTNATTTVATSFYVDLAQTLFLGGGGSQVACVNLSVTIMDNCTVSYEERLAALAAPKTDLLSFLAFGCIILNSSFVVVGAHLIATSGAAEAATNFGSLITTVGVTTLSHCTVNFRDVRTAGTGIGKLLVAKYRTLSLTDNTLMIFDDVQLNAQTYSFAAEGGHHHYGVEVVNTSTFPSVGIEVSPFQETVPPSAAPNSFIRCNATICVSQSSFKGFTSLVMPNSFTKLSASATRGGAEGFLLQLGCNVWNGTGMSLTDVVPPTTPATTLLRFVTFPASRYNNTITCNDPDTRPTTDPQMFPNAGTVFPTAITTVIAIAGLVSGLSGGTLDAPVLVVMGVSSCAPSSLRESTSSAQFLISPFYPFGDFAMVLGNLAVFVVLHLLHRVGVWWYRRQQLPNTMNSLFSQHEDHVSKSSSTRVSLRPEVALKFPNHSLLVAMLAAPGVVHGGVHGLFSGEVTGTVAGVAAIGIVAGGGYWRVRAGRSRVASKMMFLLYRNSIRKAFVAPWLLPLGQWGPPALRATHGRLRGPCVLDLSGFQPTLSVSVSLSLRWQAFLFQHLSALVFGAPCVSLTSLQRSLLLWCVHLEHLYPISFSSAAYR
ncbi:GPI-anchored surface protein, putative [Bodo saltans]|uniref:GPI-anchored surface protein, putative n=1 Tax=Bodo saltans TaxID=75058 RepID=A0A0S4J473_BODSA|nr:GPI-anchored surface protein, putative [Bodo saltans]|eukprot:CUG74470.1 GPI-anchored surface protein, putative [Bodo saltans]